MKTNNFETGLSDNQVKQKIAAGLVNTTPQSLTPSVGQIFKQNIFTYFNLLNLLIAACIIVTGNYRNLLFLIVAISNTAIGIFQELRSKNEIDKMALLAQSKVTVIRDGQLREIEPNQLVTDDIMTIKSGDQLPVDGQVVSTTPIYLDESQLTGESEPVEHKFGENVTAGTVVVGGNGTILVTKVGNDTTVAKITNRVSRQKPQSSYLINLINRIIKTLSYIILPLGIVLIFNQFRHTGNLNQSLLGGAAAMVGMIPEGLVLLTSVTLAVSAYELAKKKVLVKSLPGIETLARVDVLCSDKTGTITSGELTFEKIIPNSKFSDEAVCQYLETLINTLADDNATSRALRVKFPGTPTYPVINQTPFTSATKQSSVTLEDQTKIILGAPEFVIPDIKPETDKIIKQYASDGYRILALVIEHPNDITELITLIILSDTLRDNAVTTFNFLQKQSVTIKILSGDNPISVAAIARKAGIANVDKYLDFSTVPDDADYDKLVQKYTIFGRISPEQKEKVILSLKNLSHTPAMVGDGVNDVLALKASSSSIAMGSGSDAAKRVSDFVLVNSNFDAVPLILNEGRKVINNIQKVASLYLIKTIYSVIFTFSFIFLPFPYPFMPIQLTPVSSLTVGIPSFILSLLPDFSPIKYNFLKNVQQISFPSALTIVSYVAAFIGIGQVFGYSQQNIATLTALLIGCVCLWSVYRISRACANEFNYVLLALSVAFISVFLLFNNFFNLSNILDWKLIIIYLPAILIIPLLLYFWRLIVNYIIKLYHQFE